MADLKEVIQFLKPNTRLDVKSKALTHILSLTGTPDGKSNILSLDDMVIALFNLTLDSDASIAKDCILSLINLTAEEKGAIKIYNSAKQTHPKFDIVATAVKEIIDEQSVLADPWTMVLSNMSRVESLAELILDQMDKKTLLDLANAFANINYNKQKCHLHYLGPIFCNLTQTGRGRELICLNKPNLIGKILPFASYNDSVVRRGGTIGILKNICFDPVYHPIILHENDEVLVAILYPLCGPEEFTEEDNEMLPMNLQFLPSTKTREEDPDLRIMLLESLLQLCSSRRSREHLRSRGLYPILRAYHKWEGKVGKDIEAILACENVVDILIKKEEEIGLDNYKQVEVPEEFADRFVKEDQEYLKDLL